MFIWEGQKGKTYQNNKKKWFHSINQFSKLEQDNKKQMKINNLKLKMRNRLAQIDEQFIPLSCTQIKHRKQEQYNKKQGIKSTRYDTNVMSSNNIFSKNKVEQSIIINAQNPQQYQSTNQPNHNPSSSLSIYPYLYHQSQPLLQHCSQCDQSLKYQQHKCQPHKVLDNMRRIRQCLDRIQINEKVFKVFLFNVRQIDMVEELVENVRVLKQAKQYQFSKQQLIVRSRLINLIAKKISIILEQNQLSKKLKNLHI